MARKPTIFLWSPLIASVLILSVKGDESKCETTGVVSTYSQRSAIQNTYCSEGYTEIYYDDLPESRDYYCCPVGSVNANDESWKRCVTTSCIEGSVEENVCDSIGRHVNGERVEFVEVVRENCTYTDDTRVYHGAMGVCCMTGAPDEKFAVTMMAESHEFPHIVNFDDGCAGTVYNSRFILTAAHCIVDDDTGFMRDLSHWKGVFLGSNVAFINSHVSDYTYKIKRAIPHEKYSLLATNPENERNTYHRSYNDIGLLELEEDIKFSDNIKALEIAAPKFDPFAYADHATATGWGTTETGFTTKYLHNYNLILRNDQLCFDEGPYAGGRPFKDSLLCAGGVYEGQFSWADGRGDSGGPLICRNADGHPVLCGVVSGAGGGNGLAVLFTEVAYFHDWIVKNAGSQDKAAIYQPYLYGEEVAPSKYQHQVHITSGDGKPCGGTLVKSDIVVTAAHCIMKADGKTKVSDLKVTSDINDINSRKGITLGVTDVRILDGFKMEGNQVDIGKQGNHVVMTENFYHNDLAILKLEKETSLEQVECPRLPRKADKFDSGVELAFPTNTTRSGQLRSRDYKLMESPRCRNRVNMGKDKIGQEITVDDNTICGVEKYAGGSLCDRELGGGLICTDAAGRDVLCGVQVFRLCDYSTPNEFLDMTQVGEWVEKMVAEMK